MSDMRRREFITLIGGTTAAWPLAAGAQQQPAKVARLGYLAAASNPDLVEALRGGLRDLGYVQGQNLAIEYRYRQTPSGYGTRVPYLCFALAMISPAQGQTIYHDVLDRGAS
jgi:putative ABC transport system substrate-binding protein